MVLLFFQIRYQLLSFDENLISDTLGLLFPASVIGFIIGIVTPPFFVHYYNRILYVYQFANPFFQHLKIILFYILPLLTLSSPGFAVISSYNQSYIGWESIDERYKRTSVFHQTTTGICICDISHLFCGDI